MRNRLIEYKRNMNELCTVKCCVKWTSKHQTFLRIRKHNIIFDSNHFWFSLLIRFRIMSSISIHLEGDCSLFKIQTNGHSIIHTHTHTHTDIENWNRCNANIHRPNCLYSTPNYTNWTKTEAMLFHIWCQGSDIFIILVHNGFWIIQNQ